MAIETVVDKSSSSAEKTTDVVNSSHPYYLTPSDSPGNNLINIIFDGSNYGNWKRGVLISLSAKNKLCFVDDKSIVPQEDSPIFDHWRRCNDMVIAWLLNSLSKEISESVIYCLTVADLWNELQERYGQPDGAKLFQLQRDLNNISQGTNDVASYFNKLKKLWDQMKVLNTFMTCGCDCKCGAKTHNHKMNEDIKLMQFLMGLNEMYSGCRGNILMMKPLPSTNQAYSMILHEESQREVHNGNIGFSDSVGFNVTRWNEQRNNPQSRVNNQVAGAGYQNSGQKNNMFCTYCKKTNHVRLNCYKLIGYPADYKFTNKTKKPHNNAKANAVGTGENTFTTASEEGIMLNEHSGKNVGSSTMPNIVNSQGFTKNQCDRLIQIFKYVQSGDSQASGSENHFASMAGPQSQQETDFW